MKRVTSMIAVIAFSALALSLVASVQTKSGGAPQGNAENGKRIYVKNGCYQCHGYDAHGGTGPKLAPNPLAFPAFAAYIRHPPAGGMPVYSTKVMSDAELTDVWSYLKSVAESRPAKDIPLLNQ